jgi:hypothetical protein
LASTACYGDSITYFMHATCPTHLIALYRIVLIISGEEHDPWLPPYAVFSDFKHPSHSMNPSYLQGHTELPLCLQAKLWRWRRQLTQHKRCQNCVLEAENKPLPCAALCDVLCAAGVIALPSQCTVLSLPAQRHFFDAFPVISTSVAWVRECTTPAECRRSQWRLLRGQRGGSPWPYSLLPRPRLGVREQSMLNTTDPDAIPTELSQPTLVLTKRAKCDSESPGRKVRGCSGSISAKFSISKKNISDFKILLQLRTCITHIASFNALHKRFMKVYLLFPFWILAYETRLEATRVVSSTSFLLSFEFEITTGLYLLAIRTPLLVLKGEVRD